MPTVDQEPLLAQTGATTPLGKLLRNFWLPFTIAAELTEEHPIRPVRILAEDLVLFRETDGRPGLIQARCPHGGYALDLGSVEESGIICARHGWHFDLEGNCFVVNFTGTVYPMAWAHAKTYPVQQYAGLLWAYLGPPPAPPLPDYLSQPGIALLAAETLDLPWIAALDAAPESAEAPTVRLHLPVDDTHTWRVTLTPDSEDNSAPAASEAELGAHFASAREALLRAIARIEAGEEPIEVAADLSHPLIVGGSR